MKYLPIIVVVIMSLLFGPLVYIGFLFYWAKQAIEAGYYWAVKCHEEFQNRNEYRGDEK